MAYLMRVIGLAGEEEFEQTVYLASFDVDARDGRGDVILTGSLARAMRFESQRELFETWQTASTVRPVRPDGRPNKPLTAYTVQSEPIP